MSVVSKNLEQPNLSDESFIGAVCGLRPCRRGGIRLEHERIEHKDIIHNYGHGGCGISLAFGSAEIVSELINEQIRDKEPIAVLGGGVVGMCTARVLLRRGHQVTIYAEHIANETTSTLAGALWLPVGVEFRTDTKGAQQDKEIMVRSRAEFDKVDQQIFGIEQLTVFEPESSSTSPGIFEDSMSDVISPPTNIDHFPFPCQAIPGRMFTTDFIHTQQFLDAIYNEILDLGCHIERVRFGNIEQVINLTESTVVNCLALGSKDIFHDNQVFPARGVLVHMKPQNLGYAVHDGFKYMFPRKNALVLGGCFQEDNWNSQPDDAMVKEVIDHHRAFFGLKYS